MFPVISCFEGPPIKLTGGIFTIGTVLSVSMFYFVNRTTGRCSAPYFNNHGCADKYTYVDSFSTSLSIHDSAALLYCKIISHSHIILAGRCHITNWHCNNYYHCMCATWGILASDSNYFCILLQLYITVNSSNHKFFINFPLYQLTTTAYP